MQHAISVYKVLLVFGLVLILGEFRRWSWLIDPPNDWWPYYSQATIKRFCGKKVLLIYTYVLGAIFVIVSAIGLYRWYSGT
jgi:hypothetical protein